MHAAGIGEFEDAASTDGRFGAPLGITPILVVSDAKAATDFYMRSFGAIKIARIAAPDGCRLMHARLMVGQSLFVLMDEIDELSVAESRFRPPSAVNATTITLHLQVEDARAMWEQAVAAGASSIVPLDLQFWGELYGRLVDPFGHEWTIAQIVQQLEQAEIERAATLRAREPTPQSQTTRRPHL